jgi:hypothetical protein
MAIKSIKPKKVIVETPVKQKEKPDKPSYAIPRFSTLTKKPSNEYLVNMIKRVKKISLPCDKKALVEFVIGYHESGKSPYNPSENEKIIETLKNQLRNFAKEEKEYLDMVDAYNKFKV